MPDAPRSDLPRPTPDGSARAQLGYVDPSASDGRIWAGRSDEAVVAVATVVTRSAGPSVVAAPSQAVAAAGTAVVSAARVGRLVGRSGWRVARQLPGGRLVESEARRLQQSALNEARRLLQVPGARPGGYPAVPSVLSADEQRAGDLIRRSTGDPAPLRTAMSELLERSADSTRRDSREYLYGTIISQLTPDEARILATLAGGRRFAAADIVAKQRRGTRVLSANISTVGRHAGLLTPDNTPTYLNRLQAFGLIDFEPEDPALASQYDMLATDPAVQTLRDSVEPRRRGNVKLAHKTLVLSPFGRDFWVAADPWRPGSG